MDADSGMAESRAGGLERMTPQERHRWVMELFDQARELPGGERQRFLEQACSGDDDSRHYVESLLVHERTPIGLVSAIERGEGVRLLDFALPEDPGDPSAFAEQIGAYTILERIGQGGMGTVYRAQQENPRRMVALKIIRATDALEHDARRLQREAHVLGRLQHPGIATIFDAGAADIRLPDGRVTRLPFFAMEYIKGLPVGQFVRERQLAPDDVVRLVADICDAVQYAHDQGVIHRDLKPANILVCQTIPVAPAGAAPRTKILDFGVARLTEPVRDSATLDTHVGQLVGTVAYMSPEQAAGGGRPVDARCDIYALGVILYEMLAGRLPCEVRECSLYEALQRIQNENPRRLGDADRRFRGDLETIVHKAIAKDPLDRYRTVHELSADLRRFLAHEPLTARPPSAPYRARKFVQRNSLLVAGVVAVILVLGAGVVAERMRRLQALAAEQRAEAAQHRAETEAERAHRVVRFLNDMLHSVTPDAAGGEDVTVRQMIATVAPTLAAELGDSPEVQASVRLILGETYHELGADREAVDMLRAAALLHRELSLTNVETAHIHHALGSSLVELKQLDEALVEYNRALQLAEDLLGEESDLALQILNDRGQVFYQRGQLHEVEATLREVAAIRARAFGEDDPDLHTTRVNLGMVLQQQGKLAESAELMRAARTWLHAHAGPTDSMTIAVTNALIGVEFDSGRLAEADRLAQQLIESYRSRFGPDHPAVADALFEQGVRFLKSYRLPQAEEALREAVRIREARFGSDHIVTAAASSRLGVVIARLGRLAEALALEQHAVASYRANPAAPRIELAWALHEYAAVLTEAERFDEALAASREALGYLQSAYGADSARALTAEAQIANTLLRAGRREEALVAHERVLDRRRSALGAEHPDTASAAFNLAINLFEIGRLDEARELLTATAAQFLRQYGADSPAYCAAVTRLAVVALHLDDAVAAEANAEQARACPDFTTPREALLGRVADAVIAQAALARNDVTAAEVWLAERPAEPPPNRWEAAWVLMSEARVLHALGRDSDALALIQQAWEFFTTSFGPDHPFAQASAALRASVQTASN